MTMDLPRPLELVMDPPAHLYLVARYLMVPETTQMPLDPFDIVPCKSYKEARDVAIAAAGWADKVLVLRVEEEWRRP